VEIFRKRVEGILQIRTSALFCAKNFGFVKFMVCPLGQGGLSQCGHFFGQGERGSIFRDFVPTPFMDGPLEQILLIYSIV